MSPTVMLGAQRRRTRQVLHEIAMADARTDGQPCMRFKIAPTSIVCSIRHVQLSASLLTPITIQAAPPLVRAHLRLRVPSSALNCCQPNPSKLCGARRLPLQRWTLACAHLALCCWIVDGNLSNRRTDEPQGSSTQGDRNEFPEFIV